MYKCVYTSVFTCTDFICMSPSVSHCNEKQYLREIPSKFEELHFHFFALFEACGSLDSLLIYLNAFQEILVQAINPRAIPARKNSLYVKYHPLLMWQRPQEMLAGPELLQRTVWPGCLTQDFCKAHATSLTWAGNLSSSACASME